MAALSAFKCYNDRYMHYEKTGSAATDTQIHIIQDDSIFIEQTIKNDKVH